MLVWGYSWDTLSLLEESRKILTKFKHCKHEITLWSKGHPIKEWANHNIKQIHIEVYQQMYAFFQAVKEKYLSFLE